MQAAYHRHDITDDVWEKFAPHLPGQPGQWGGIAEDNRRFINAVFWILRTGAPWRDLPPEQSAATRTWSVQKEAQHQDTLGRG